MNEKPIQSTKPAVLYDPVTGKVKRPKRWLLFIKRHKILLVTVIFWVLLAGGGLTYWLVTKQHDEPIVADLEYIDNIETVVEGVNAAAKKLEMDGDVASATLEYDNAISQTDDQTLKNNLLTNKALLFYNNGMYEEALAIELAIEAVEQKNADYAFIAQIYQAMGNKTKAIEYYKLAIANADPESILVNDYTEYYNYQVKLLSEGQGL